MLDCVLQALHTKRKLILENFLLTFRRCKLSACRAHWQAGVLLTKGTSGVTDISKSGYFFIASFYPEVALSAKNIF